MPTLVTPRLASQLQRHITTMAYTDTAQYIPAPDTMHLDEYGQPAESTQTIKFNCAFASGGKSEQWKDFADIEVLDAQIYFDAFAPSKGATIKPLTRFGKAVTNKTYEIVGIQDRGAFGYVCALKAITI